MGGWSKLALTAVAAVPALAIAIDLYWADVLG
jgi:hypothetical protein